MMQKDSRILIAGYRGLVGSAIHRRLQAAGYDNLLLLDRSRVDLRDQRGVSEYFESTRPEYVFLAAARVGGILANDTYPADFIYDNVVLEANVIHASWRSGVKKLLFLGSSCIYPKHAPQPMKEEDLLTGPLEPTNESYAIAKIAGIKMVQAFHRQHGFSGISLMPTNLYGPGDNFDLNSSHVLPALIRKFDDAKRGSAPEVTVWGTGKPRREFLYVDDLADASLFLMLKYDQPEIINVGVGEDVTIAELAETVRKVVGYEGRIVYDTSKPDGTPRKLLDVSRLNALGWRASTPLQEGIQRTYRCYLENRESRVRDRAVLCPD